MSEGEKQTVACFVLHSLKFSAEVISHSNLNIFKQSNTEMHTTCQLLVFACKTLPLLTESIGCSWNCLVPTIIAILHQDSVSFRCLPDAALCSSPWTTSGEIIFNRSHLRLNREDGNPGKSPCSNFMMNADKLLEQLLRKQS